MGKNNKTNGKVTINAGKIVAVYQKLSIPTNEMTGRQGFNLSSLDVPDIFKVLRISNALKPVAEAFENFRKDAREKLKPENWKEITEKSNRFKDLSDDEKVAVNKAFLDYDNKVNECVNVELEKDKEIDAFEHLSEETLGKIFKSNSHLLDIPSMNLFVEILG